MIHPVKKVLINDHIAIGGNEPFALIAGPCVIESEDVVFEIAEKMKKITNKLGIPFIFKASFDKANRSSIFSYRGIGLEEGTEILGKVKENYQLPVITDVHEPWQCEVLAKTVDVLQIPAFLCRQTDLLRAAAKTGLPVHVKKGQFLAPWDMKHVIRKIEEQGNERILLCERGVSFGYNNLIVDMRSLVELRKFHYPVVLDITHSVQRPGARGDTSGGEREYAFPLLRAGIATGVDAIFAEVHPEPDQALSDGPNMIRLDEVEKMLKVAIEIDQVVKASLATQFENEGAL